jgi:hypothetical protein
LHPVIRYVRVLLRAELLVARMQLRAATRRCALFAFGAIVAALGVGMLNVAAFFGLEPYWGPMWAALGAAGGDILIAVFVIAIALAARSDSELEAALELRRAATDGIEAEIGPLQNRVVWLSHLTRDPIETALPAVLVPLVTAIVRGLRKSKPD